MLASDNREFESTPAIAGDPSLACWAFWPATRTGSWYFSMMAGR